MIGVQVDIVHPLEKGIRSKKKNAFRDKKKTIKSKENLTKEDT